MKSEKNISVSDLRREANRIVATGNATRLGVACDAIPV